MNFKATKIWDIEFSPNAEAGPGHEEIHPDLCWFKGHFYCGFKEGGRSRIIRSADGLNWEHVHLFEWDGGRVTDPRMSITAEGCLMVITGIRFGDNVSRSDDEAGGIRRQSVTWLTRDGAHWEPVNAPAVGVNNIMFDATWRDGMGYCLAYFGKDFAGTLYRTRDGRDWRVLAENVFPEAHRHGYEEAALAFDPRDGTAYALVRAKPVHAILGVSRGPYYQNWDWRDLNVDWNADGDVKPASEILGQQMCGPKLVTLSDGRLVAAGIRDAATETENRGFIYLSWCDPAHALLTPFAKLDGYGNYPGVVEKDGSLWVSCSQGTKGEMFNLFMVKMDVPK